MLIRNRLAIAKTNFFLPNFKNSTPLFITPFFYFALFACGLSILVVEELLLQAKHSEMIGMVKKRFQSSLLRNCFCKGGFLFTFVFSGL